MNVSPLANMRLAQIAVLGVGRYFLFHLVLRLTDVVSRGRAIGINILDHPGIDQRIEPANSRGLDWTK